MKRRDLLLIVLVFTVAPFAAPAQTPQRVWRVGVLTPTRAAIDTIRRVTIPELAKVGFVEGRNVIFHEVSADSAFDRLPALGRELVATNPDVIIAVAPNAIRAARAATSTIPIVMSFAGEDPVAAGWAQSYARPGGNMTGIVLLSPELDAKRLTMLVDAFPARRHVAALFHPRSIHSPNDWAVQTTARRIGLEVTPFVAGGADEYGPTFAAMKSAGVEALLIASSTVFRADAARLADLALEAGVPTICEWPDMAEAGCLISYGPTLTVLFARVASYVARILQGTPAGELPLEDPTTFQVTVNLKTAKALGLVLPTSLLARADVVIE